MFATSPRDMVDAGGVAPDPNTVQMRPEPSFGENVVQSAVAGAMGHASELGSVYLGQRFLHDQTDSIRKHDPEFADSLKNNYGSLPDVANGISSKNPEIGTWAAHLAGADPKQDLIDTIDSQKKIEEWRKNHPEAFDVPSIGDGVAQVKRQQNIVDDESSQAQERSAGVNLPLLGKVSGAGLVGGILSSFAPSNPTQALFNIGLAGTGGISKDIISNTYGRVAANAVTNGVVSAVSQSAIAAPAAEQYGVKRDYKQEAFGVLANTLLGGMISGVHEVGEHYFPATTPKGIEEVKGAVDNAPKEGSVGEALNELKSAETPDQAQAIATKMPLETRLDVLHAVSPNPSAEERGVINAGERDLVLDKGFNQAGMEYPEGIQHAEQVEKAIESGNKIPETNQTKNIETLPALSAAPTADEQKQPIVVKKPIQAWLQRKGGVRSGSNLAEEVKNIGIQKLGLIRNFGRLTDVDNIPHSEWESEFGPAPADETGNYVDRQHILNELAKENGAKDNTSRIEPGSQEDLEVYAHSLGVETGGKNVESVIGEIKDQEAALERASREQDEVEYVGAREEQKEALDEQTQAKYDAIERKVFPEEKSLIKKVTEKVLGSKENEEQPDFFKDLKPEDRIPVDDENPKTVKDALEDIKDQEGLLNSMKTCFLGQ